MAAESNETSWRECDRVYTNEKAGMAEVDKELVKKTIYDMSKDSEHFKNEQRKQQQLETRIERLKQVEAALTEEKEKALRREADDRLVELRASRDLSQIWFHVDMDAFFAAVEELHNPSLVLKGRPMAVGGKAMISTANYEARKYGVRSAMPGFIALKLCPQLVFVPNDFAKYRAASDQTRHVFRRFDPDFEAGSLDEAYLNVTDYIRTQTCTPAEAASELREAVSRETGLTCSVGIAPNCMLAKVASDMNKPNGQYEIPSSESQILDFLKSLPVRKVSGIGRVSEQTLCAFGVESCADLIEKRGLISALFSRSSLEFFLEIGMGIGRTTHHEATAPGEIGRKGMSCERTFRPTDNTSDLLKKLEELSVELARHLAQENLKGKTLTLKLKSQTFEVHTRALTLRFFVSSAKELYTQSVPLLELEMAKGPFRLMGIRLSNFESKGRIRQSMITDFLDYRTENATSSIHPSKQCSHPNASVSEALKCDECGMHCCGEKCLQEHHDFHLAYVFQRQENTLAPQCSPSPVPLPATNKDRKIRKKKTSRKKKSVATKNVLTLEALVLRDDR